MPAQTAKLYALATSLLTAATFALPVSAAVINTYQIEGTGTAQDGSAQRLTGRFNEDFTEYLFSVNGIPFYDNVVGLPSYQGFNVEGNFTTASRGTAYSIFSYLDIFTTTGIPLVGTLGEQPTDTFEVSWFQSGVYDRTYANGLQPAIRYNTEGYGTANVSFVSQAEVEPIPEPGQVLGLFGAGGLLLGAAFLKKRKTTRV